MGVGLPGKVGRYFWVERQKNPKTRPKSSVLHSEPKLRRCAEPTVRSLSGSLQSALWTCQARHTYVKASPACNRKTLQCFVNCIHWNEFVFEMKTRFIGHTYKPISCATFSSDPMKVPETLLCWEHERPAIQVSVARTPTRLLLSSN